MVEQFDPDRLNSIIPKSLPVVALRRLCDPDRLEFQSTDDLPDLQSVIGQPRAFRALELGSEVQGPGYNTFILGLPGSGRTTLSLEYFTRRAAVEPVPDDWCYVNNFDEPRMPKSVRLPAGRGQEFAKDIHNLIGHCERDITKAFSSEEYTQDRDLIINDLKKAQEVEFLRMQDHVQKYNFVLIRSTVGFILAPAVKNKPLKPEEIEALSEDQRVKLAQLQTKLSEEVDITLNKLRNLEKQAFEQLNDLNERTVGFLLHPLILELSNKYSGIDTALDYIGAVQADILANTDQFRKTEETQTDFATLTAKLEWKRRYKVNVIVDNSQLQGAPVILESQPSYNNILGRIEHEVIMGGSRTDFTMIRAGALHRANGGYLIIPARDLLVSPYTWEGLKRVLRDREIRISELALQLGLLSTVTLDPMPIPVDVKVILVGTPLLYYLLRAYDEDFSKLFKVRAEFATIMERTIDAEKEYALFVRSVVNDYQLPAFSNKAIAKIIEYGSRLAEDQNKLSTRFGKISDLVREAAYWATKENHSGYRHHREQNQEIDLPLTTIVEASHIQKAIEESIYRSNLVDERIQNLIQEGTFLIETLGSKVGQVNALSVLILGDYAFGRPSRITASAYPGRNGIVDIERQAKLGGPIHTKGVLIIAGLLAARYGRNKPLSLTANLTFEQSYDEVEGDSASTAELLALLSAISDFPIRQDRAITGSINQLGQIQAIGGVNEKIEGFFNICKKRGLTGEQGVVIPASNTNNLMLNDDVSIAVESGNFHIWAISTLEEAIWLLMHVDPGARQADGSYLDGTLNHAVMTQLAGFSQVAEPMRTKGAEE